MLRLLEARNADNGKERKFTGSGAHENIGELLAKLETGQATGLAQRFNDYCKTICINRKLIMVNMGLGVESAQELASIISVNPKIAHLNLR